jgi:PKHD-type hydroxylase
MLLQIPAVLDGDDLCALRSALASAPWCDGRTTAGEQSAKAKNNQQLPEDDALTRELQQHVLGALKRSSHFFTAVLPRHVFPPLFNRYAGASNAFGDHVDNAIRIHRASGERLRTDVSATLFLSDPADYDGGELVIDDSFGPQRVKLAAGDLVVYPSSSVHRVEPVTRGERIASVFWIESMVRETERRRLLYELDMAILALRSQHGDDAHSVRLTATYHNLLRMWASS